MESPTTRRRLQRTSAVHEQHAGDSAPASHSGSTSSMPDAATAAADPAAPAAAAPATPVTTEADGTVVVAVPPRRAEAMATTATTTTTTKTPSVVFADTTSTAPSKHGGAASATSSASAGDPRRRVLQSSMRSSSLGTGDKAAPAAALSSATPSTAPASTTATLVPSSPTLVKSVSMQLPATATAKPSKLFTTMQSMPNMDATDDEEDGLLPEGFTDKRMKVVAVLTANSSAQRVQAAVEEACESVGARLECIKFSEFDFGGHHALEKFYSADVVFTDITDRKIQSSLFYQIGVRESLGRSECVITLNVEKQDMAERMRMSPAEVVLYQIKNGVCVTTAEDDLLEDEESTPNTQQQPLTLLLEQRFSAMQPKALTQRKKWFMQALRKTKKIKDQEKLAVELGKLQKTMIQDPSFVSADVILNLALAYRDIQDYGSVIELVDALQDHKAVRVTRQPSADYELNEEMRKRRLAQIAIKVQYANALIRRKRGGDREKALNILLNEVVTEKNCVEDHLCLVGRVYKDMFIDSDYQDLEVLGEAINWYRRGFEVQQSEFAGINLATLLVVSGESFSSNNELAHIGMCMNISLGRKGNLDTIQDYWAVATVFEMSILAEDYAQALKAASRMYTLKPPTWYLKSTLNNIRLIVHQRQRRSASYEVEQRQIMDVFSFWMEMFEATISDSDELLKECPVLLFEPLKDEMGFKGPVFQPCRIVIDEPSQTMDLFNVCLGSDKLSASGVALPKVPSEFKFKLRDIKRVMAHNDDPYCLYLYASTDFQLHCPSEKFRQLLRDAIRSIGPTKTSTLHTQDREHDIKFEFERDNRGQKVQLGRGSFGVVYSARDLDTLQLIAVKEVEIKNPRDIQPLQEEIDMHKRWSHPHIVQYLGSQVCDKTFRVFMEQVPGGSLSDLLINKWGPLEDNEPLIADYTKQLLRGLNYLHERKVVHRDVKGDNVLVNQFDGKLKLSDFGTSKRLAGLNPQTEATVGTAQFMAPEVINSERGYGLPADIWSIGCTVIEMATGLPPFHDYNPAAAMFKVGRDRAHPDYPRSMSDTARSFLDMCFKPMPEDRASAKELLDNVFIKKPKPRQVQRAVSAATLSKQNSVQAPAGGGLQLETPGSPNLDFRRSVTTPAYLSAPLSPTEDSPFDRQLSDYGSEETLARTVSEHHVTIQTLVGFMQKDDIQICYKWHEALKRSEGGPVGYAAEPVLSEDFLQDTHAELTTIISLDEELPQPTQRLCDHFMAIDSGVYSELLHALTLYRDVLGDHLKAKHSGAIKPHWMFDIDKRIQRAVKAVRAELMRSEPAEKSRMMARRKSIAVLRQPLLTEERRGTLRRHHSDAPNPQSPVASPQAVKRQFAADHASRGKRAAFQSSFSVEGASAATSLTPSVFSANTNSYSYDMDIDAFQRLEDDNRWLLCQLLESNRNLNARLSVALTATQSVASVLPEGGLQGGAEAAPMDEDTLGETADAGMVTFLRQYGFGDDVIHTLAREEFTLDILHNNAEKEDLRVIRRAGPRCRLWGLIQQHRANQSEA